MEYQSRWEAQYTGNYKKLVVDARVTNNGGNGVVSFKCEVFGDISGKSSDTTSLYLKTGEQDYISYYFWVNPNSKSSYKVYTIITP